MKILVVDDDPKFRAYLSRGLLESGFECSVAGSVAEARVSFSSSESRPGLVLLDVMMPGDPGWTFLAELRDAGETVPVIFVTARHSVDERIRGLEMGADDYVIKPFDFSELVARIHAVTRRQQAPTRLELGDVVLDTVRRTIDRGERRIEVSAREFDLLRELMERPGEVRSRADLLSRVWEIEFDPGTNVVDVTIARLRRKLEQNGAPLIHTVVGEGYCLALAPPPRRDAGGST